MSNLFFGFLVLAFAVGMSTVSLEAARKRDQMDIEWQKKMRMEEQLRSDAEQKKGDL